MIDDKIIDELREYLKDNYIPSNDSSIYAISIANTINAASSSIGIAGHAAVSESFSKASSM